LLLNRSLLQTSEAVDVVSKVLKDTYEQENAPAQHSPGEYMNIYINMNVHT
jgi:hypothetical protein